MNNLIISVGIPGSGKSTFWNEFKKHNKCVIVSQDELRLALTGDISNQEENFVVSKLAKKLISIYLGARTENEKYHPLNVVVDSTNLKVKYLNELLQFLPEHRLLFKIFDCTPEVAKARIAKDLQDGKMRSAVPDEKIDQMYDSYLNMVKYIKDNKLQILE